jgi:hemerythrin-like domain-containing protein
MVRGDAIVHVLDIIRDEHHSMSRLLALLEDQVELFENGSVPDYDLMREIIEYFLTFPDLFHHPKENLILAKLRQRAPDLALKVGDLEAEHATISGELHGFAHALSNVLLDVELPRDSFVKLARAFIAREREHMSEEEAVFFPAAQVGLTEADWDDLAAMMRAARDPLFDRAKVRFALIRGTECD